MVDLTQAGAAFVVAGVWISLATILAERLGARTGGLVANLPSNILVAFVFVGIAHGEPFATEAARAVPIGMAIDQIFLLAFVLLLPRGLVVAVAGSLGAWVVLAFVARELMLSRLAFTIPVFLVVTFVAFAIIARRVETVEGARRAYGPEEIALRALFAGAVVGGTVLVSGLAGSYWTGLLGTFPAVLLSTMVILARRQGVAFAQATGKVLVLGSTNIVVFALAVRAAYPVFGIGLGTAIALSASIAWVALLAPLVRRLA